MNYFPASFTRGAEWLRKLRSIQPGQAMDITAEDLSDVSVTASIYDRQTPEYLVTWLHGRLPFYCIVTHDLVLGRWTFTRPKQTCRAMQ